MNQLIFIYIISLSLGLLLGIATKYIYFKVCKYKET